MTTSMFDAREAMVPGSVYDRTSTNMNGQFNFPNRPMPLDMFTRTHDPISYISPERAQTNINLPVPVSKRSN